MTGADYRELVITDLADSEAELVERVAELEADNRWLRATLREAVSMLHRVNVKFDQAQRTIRDLRQALQDERRAA